MRFGMQFYPLPAAPQTAAYAKRAMSQHPFARLWVPDHLTHENPFVTLAAILAHLIYTLWQVLGGAKRASARS